MKFLFCIFIFQCCLSNATQLNCDYYKKKQTALGCSKTNYLVSYGYRYCQIFEKKINRWKNQNKINWAKKTAQCLQDKIKTNTTLTCSNIESYAFKTHAQCYVNAGFCDLERLERVSIVLGIIRLNTFLKFKKSNEQYKQIRFLCKKDFLEELNEIRNDQRRTLQSETKKAPIKAPLDEIISDSDLNMIIQQFSF